MDEWIGINEAADLLGVSPSTVHADIAADRLRTRDLGSQSRPRWLVSRAHVEQVVAEGGRTDRRKLTVHPADIPAAANDPGLSDRIDALESERRALQLELDNTRERIAELESELERLKFVARNANVAVQSQTESLQQFLIEQSPGGL